MLFIIMKNILKALMLFLNLQTVIANNAICIINNKCSLILSDGQGWCRYIKAIKISEEMCKYNYEVTTKFSDDPESAWSWEYEEGEQDIRCNEENEIDYFFDNCYCLDSYSLGDTCKK